MSYPELAELSQKLGSGAVWGDRPGVFPYALELLRTLWGHFGAYDVAEVRGGSCHRDPQAPKQFVKGPW